MVKFRDFLPQLVKQGALLSEDEYQSFNDLLSQANQWISTTQIKVLNIETVLLRDRDSNTARFLAEEPYCYQVLRVWYESED